MFAEALSRVQNYVLPVLLARRLFGGNSHTGVGTAILLNDQGWVLTCVHMIGPFFAAEKDAAELAAYKVEVDAIENDGSLKPRQRVQKKKRLKPNNQWITDTAISIGPFTAPSNWHYDADVDLAIGKMPTAPKVDNYPVFPSPDMDLPFGRSLCRLGFPFIPFRPTYDETTKQFAFPEGLLPLPSFPNDGIYTRDRFDVSPGRRVRLIETSTPGLRGQSGGPIFDLNGVVWGVQTKTHHLDLGFNPQVKRNGKDVVEHQFISLGLGVHSFQVTAMLTHLKIPFDVYNPNLTSKAAGAR